MAAAAAAASPPVGTRQALGCAIDSDQAVTFSPPDTLVQLILESDSVVVY